MNKLTVSLTKLKTAFERLQEALQAPKTDLHRDAAIQRFEFTLDLTWKVLKTYLEERKGILVSSPKDAFRQAFQSGVIDYDEAWLEFVDLRNQTSHTYSQEKAQVTFDQLPRLIPYIQTLILKLSQ